MALCPFFCYCYIFDACFFFFLCANLVKMDGKWREEIREMEWNGNGKARPEWHRLHCTGLDWTGLNYINGIRVSCSHGVCRCACTCTCCERFACAVAVAVAIDTLVLKYLAAGKEVYCSIVRKRKRFRDKQT